jgi:23S rRNA G2069 N7-methylase RlmK/C1962 C5-methylase RlmI
MTTDLENRLKKKYTTISKWAKQQNISCYRVYTKDLAEFPFILDIYNTNAVVWFFDRKKDTSTQHQETYIKTIIQSITTSLPINESQLYLKFRSKQKGLQQQYSKLASHKNIIIIDENSLKFELNLSDYLDVGIFLDHRKSRKLTQQFTKNKSLLNLFAYTGSFSLYAYQAGATHTTSVDLNKNYLTWIERNFQHNTFKKRSTDKFIYEDCFKFLSSHHYKEKYDVIICDPPTFSNSKKMKQTLSINTDYIDLIKLCTKKLNQNGIIVFSTNSKSFKLDINMLPEEMYYKNITQKTIPFDFKNLTPHQCWLFSFSKTTLDKIKI